MKHFFPEIDTFHNKFATKTLLFHELQSIKVKN